MAAEIRDLILRTLDYLECQQLESGDIPCFEIATDSFCSPCTFLSTLIHDALACFDPTDQWHEPGLLLLFPAREKYWLTKVASEMRWRIRNFICWQEERDATWQLYGRESCLGADANTTACAALTIRHTFNRSAAARHIHSVERFLDCGLSPLEKANVLRFLSVAGRNVAAHVEEFRDEIRLAAKDSRTRIDKLTLLGEIHGIARAWRHAGWPYLNEVTDELVPQILGGRNEEGQIEGQLSRALAISALIDLGYDASRLRETALELMESLEDPTSWRPEAYARLPIGSPAAGIGIALGALARISLQTGGSLC